jgi:hypothetical protein
MIEHLEGLPVSMVYVREEVAVWPELLAALNEMGRVAPVPLVILSRTTVDVRAAGVLRVEVNQQPVALPPTGRTAELLVYLLEHGGQATLERLMDALAPEATSKRERERARKALWNAVERLREALGWPGSVQALGSAYRLDPGVTWQYDMTEIRRNGSQTAALFMDGLYADWVLEVRASLE